MTPLFFTHVELTEAMCDAIEAIGRAAKSYAPGQMSASLIEIPKLALADATLAAVKVQMIKAAHAGKAVQLGKVAKAKPVQVPVVELELRRKRKKLRA